MYLGSSWPVRPCLAFRLSGALAIGGGGVDCAEGTTPPQKAVKALWDSW